MPVVRYFPTRSAPDVRLQNIARYSPSTNPLAVPAGQSYQAASAQRTSPSSSFGGSLPAASNFRELVCFPLLATLLKDAFEELRGWLDVRMVGTPLLGQLPFDGSFEYGSPITLEIRLGPLQAGDTGIEVGESSSILATMRCCSLRGGNLRIKEPSWSKSTRGRSPVFKWLAKLTKSLAFRRNVKKLGSIA